MIPAPFDYFAPTSLREALDLLETHGDEAKLLAGGHSLLPTMKLRLAAPSVLIDLNQIDDLRTISGSDPLRIGAMATYQQIAEHAEVQRACPVLPKMIALVGDPQVRNRGTLGGSLAHADPAADPPALMLALGAMMLVQGPKSERRIAASDFFVDMLTTALEPDEILTAIEIPALGSGETAAYHKLAQPASGYALVGVAVYLKQTAGTISACRIAVTGAGPLAQRRGAAEAALLGQPATAEHFAQAAALAAADFEVLGDIHASAKYRQAMIEVVTRRALSEAAQQKED